MNGVNIGGSGLSGAPRRARTTVPCRRRTRVAHPQVLVRDALAARQEAVRELLRLQRGVAPTFSNHSVELRAAFWIFSTSTERSAS